MKPLREFLQQLTFHLVDFGAGYVEGKPGHGREQVTTIEAANVASSRIGVHGWDDADHHALLLDIDVPAWLVPSSTEGHSHLYVETLASWEDVVKFLDAAEAIGLVEPGYVAAAKARGYTSLRLPWIKKSAPVPLPASASGSVVESPSGWYGL